MQVWTCIRAPSPQFSRCQFFRRGPGEPQDTLDPHQCCSLHCFPLLSGLSALPAPLGLVPHSKLCVLSHPDLGPARYQVTAKSTAQSPVNTDMFTQRHPASLQQDEIRAQASCPQPGGSLALSWLPRPLRKVASADLHVPLGHLMAWRHHI